MELQADFILEGRYSVIKKIGEGCFGRVYKGLDMKEKCDIAIKQIPESKFKQTPKLRELFDSEVKIIQQVKSENVVSFVDYFKTADSNYLVIEYCDSGDLEEHLKKRKQIPEGEAIEFFKQILNGFKGLHEINAVHRDLKAANILMHNKGSILKVADLGFGKILKDGDIGRTVLGTSLTMAPEVLENKSYGFEVDVYSLGVIFYQILFGVFPYQGRSDPELLQNIKTKPLNLQPNAVLTTDSMKDLLKGMICYSRDKRIKWPDIYKHPIFSLKRNNAENVSMAYLQSSKIQLKQNGDFYERQAQKLQQNMNRFEVPVTFDQNIPNNPFANQYYGNAQVPVQQQQLQQHQQPKQIQQQVQPLKQPYPNVLQGNYNSQQLLQQQQQQQMQYQQQQYQKPIQKQDQQQELERVKAEMREKKIINEQINKIAEYYVHYRNMYGQLIKTVNQAHSLPNTRVNTFVPIFLVQKKLYVMNKYLLTSLKERKNVFNMNHFEAFLNSPLSNSCLQLVTEEECIIRLYFNQLRQEVVQILQQNQVMPTLKSEVDSEDIQPTYSELLKQVMLNYQMGLQQVRMRFQPNDQRKIFVHEVQVLEIVNLDNLIDKVDFDFEHHNQVIQATPHQQFDDIIAEKQCQLFG